MVVTVIFTFLSVYEDMDLSFNNNYNITIRYQLLFERALEIVNTNIGLTIKVINY